MKRGYCFLVLLFVFFVAACSSDKEKLSFHFNLNDDSVVEVYENDFFEISRKDTLLYKGHASYRGDTIVLDTDPTNYYTTDDRRFELLLKNDSVCSLVYKYVNDNHESDVDFLEQISSNQFELVIQDCYKILK